MVSALCFMIALQAPLPGPAGEASPGGLTLRAAIVEALVASPLLGRAHDGRELARIREDLAESSFRPQLTPRLRAATAATGIGNVGIGLDVTQRLRTGTELRIGATAARTTGAFASRGAAYSVEISQPLLRTFGGIAAHPLQQSRRDVVSSERALIEAREELIVTVAGAFLDVLQLERQVAAGDRAIERARRMVAASQARVGVGLSTQLDVSRAEYLGAQSEAIVLQQRESRDAAIDRLRSILGRPLDGPLRLTGDLAAPHALLEAFVPPETGGAEADTLAALTASALAHRIDLREARDRVRDATAARSVARWSLLPDLTAQAAYTQFGSGSVQAPLLYQDGGWRFGIFTEYSLSRAEGTAAAASASVSVRGAERAVSEMERLVAAQVRSAHREWIRTGASIALHVKAVELAERQVRLAQIREERGLAGNFDVVDAESHLFEAQSALIETHAARALAGLRLRRAAGALDTTEYMK